MIALGLFMLVTLLQMNCMEADGEYGYEGCYLVGSAWQDVLINGYKSTSVDDCVGHCSNYPYAATSLRSCYCSNRLAESLKANDNQCNTTCECNPKQICGSRAHYAIYNVAERLRRTEMTNRNLACPVKCNETSNSLSRCKVNGSIHDSECVQETCLCQELWIRIVIDVAVIIVVLCLFALILLTVRICRKRQRGRMFDEWKPRSFGHTGHMASSRTGDDLLNRNHSYRNLSGSSTLDRGLESRDQVMVASGRSAVIESLDDDRRSRYGSLPALAKKESVSTASPRAVTLNSRKLTGVPFAVNDSTPGNSEEGYYHETEFLTPPDHLRNQHVPPEPKNKPRHSSKTSQKECPKDGTEEKDAVLDKPKRRSLLNFLSKDSGKPSFQEPSKDEGASPKDPGSFLDKTWGSRHGNKGKKKTEAAVKRNSSGISEDEKVFEHPKSKTLPNDIYAVPNKPGRINKQRKERPNSDATEGAKSGDVEHQDGYSRLSRLFKPRARGSSKPTGADDTPSNEYSALQPDSKGTDYDKLGQGDTDGPFDRDKNDVAEKPEAETYASLNDTEYAAVGEETPGAAQSTDYEMIACGQKGQK